MNEDFIKKTVFDLMFLGRAPLSRTSEFKTQKHNKILVPAFNTKLEDIINLFERYHKVSYDIQGIRDNGVDVLLKYEYGSEDISIGIQIKSFDDLEDDRWLNNLKAQVTDAKNCYRLADYYIVFCTDEVAHKDKIRNAAASLSQIKNTYIVTPQQALHFLEFKQHQIAAHIKRKVSEEDCVVVDAKDSLVDLTLGQSALLIEAAASFVENGEADLFSATLTGSSFVREVYEVFPNLPSEVYEYEDSMLLEIAELEYPIDIETDLQKLCDQGNFEFPTYSEVFKFEHGFFTPIIAIMYEAIARYDYKGAEMRWYTFSLIKELEIILAQKVLQLRGD